MLPAKTVVRPAVLPGRRRRLEGLGPVARALRGSGRPSAGRSPRPGLSPIIVLTVSAKPSIEIADESSARTPREVITVIAPKESGISAATGERKTSSRTSSRIGRAISSLRSGGGDRFVLDRPREGGEAGLGRLDRRRHLFFEDLVEFVDRVADRVVDADVEVGEDQRLVRRRPQVADFALVPGRDGRHLRVARAQRVDQRRALFFDLLGRALEQDRERRRVAEVLRAGSCWRGWRRCPGRRARSG